MRIDNAHEVSCLICYFWKKKTSKIWSCCLLQIVGGALKVNFFQEEHQSVKQFGSRSNWVQMVCTVYRQVKIEGEKLNSTKIFNK